jgi:hypothetical protein
LMGVSRFFLPKHTVPRQKEIRFFRRAQTQIPDKRIAYVAPQSSQDWRQAR